MATKLSSVTCNGVLTYLNASGQWDHNGDIHIYDDHVDATEVTKTSTKAQRGTWVSGEEDENGLVTVIGELHQMDSQDVQGQGKRITVVIEPPTDQYPAGRGGYSLTEAKPDLQPFSDAPGQGADDMETTPA